MGKNQRKTGHCYAGRSDEMPLHWKPSMSLQSVIAEMKTRQYFFLAQGFPDSPQKSSTLNAYCLYSQMRLGEARHKEKLF